MKTTLEVKLTIEVDTEEITLEELLNHSKNIDKVWKLYSIPSVDRDSIKVESIEVK